MAKRKAKPVQPAPPAVNIGAVKHYLNAFDGPRAANRMLATLLVLSILAILILGFGIDRMLPLKQRIPYFVTSDQSTGQVSVSKHAAVRFTPSEANERYFLAKWVKNLLTVDTNTKSQGLPDSYAMLRGAALTEWKSFVFNKWQPIKRLRQTPDLRIYPTIVAIGFVTDTSAVIRVALHNAGTQEVGHMLITVSFAILPPTSDAQIYRNPIGMWITHFGVQRES